MPKDKRKADECALVTQLDSCVSSNLPKQSRPGQWDDCGHEQSPGIQTAESVWDLKSCIACGNEKGGREQNRSRG